LLQSKNQGICNVSTSKLNDMIQVDKQMNRQIFHQFSEEAQSWVVGEVTTHLDRLMSMISEKERRACLGSV
jgi:hypothetical protein